MVTTNRLERALAALSTVVDPEIPALTIEDMGILRGVVETADGITVTITPTYSGCPAMGQITRDIEAALESAGAGDIRIETVFSPAWTSDWMTPDARHRLEQSGIAPPSSAAESRCPRCRAGEPRTLSEFGSTACKALMVCSACGEPFDLFKAI